MYLKEIVTSGFKSFADKLDIKLDDKSIVIVGNRETIIRYAIESHAKLIILVKNTILFFLL